MWCHHNQNTNSLSHQTHCHFAYFSCSTAVLSVTTAASSICTYQTTSAFDSSYGHFTPHLGEGTPISIEYEIGSSPEPVRTCCGVYIYIYIYISCPYRDSNPDLPARRIITVLTELFRLHTDVVVKYLKKIPPPESECILVHRASLETAQSAKCLTLTWQQSVTHCVWNFGTWFRVCNCALWTLKLRQLAANICTPSLYVIRTAHLATISLSSNKSTPWYSTYDIHQGMMPGLDETFSDHKESYRCLYTSCTHRHTQTHTHICIYTNNCNCQQLLLIATYCNIQHQNTAFYRFLSTVCILAF